MRSLVRSQLSPPKQKGALRCSFFCFVGTEWGEPTEDCKSRTPKPLCQANYQDKAARWTICFCRVATRTIPTVPTKTKRVPEWVPLFCFIQDRRAWYGINSQSELHGIAACPRMASRGSVHPLFGLDSIPPAADSRHGFAVMIYNTPC